MGIMVKYLGCFYVYFLWYLLIQGGHGGGGTPPSYDFFRKPLPSNFEELHPPCLEHL